MALYSRTFRNKFATSSSVLYEFYTDAANDLFYRKSIDGGLTWAAGVDVSSIPGSVLVTKFSIWAEWWTPGMTGPMIHIVWTESTNDDAHYRSLDTSNDGLGTPTTPFLGATHGGDTWDVNIVDITELCNGDLICAYAIDGAGESGAARSIDSGATWAAISNIFDGVAIDNVRLCPSDGAINDAIAMYWDYSANEISRKVYDGTGDSWAETLISAGFNEFSTSFAGLQMDAAVLKSNGDIYLAAWTHAGLNSADLKTFIVNSSSITAKTDIITGELNHIAVSVQIDQANGDVYVVYGGDPTDTWATALNVRYKLSTDDMTTWASAVQSNEDAAESLRAVYSDKSSNPNGGRFEPSWFNDVADDLKTNVNNSVVLASSVTPPIVPPAPVGSAGNPPIQPWLAAGSIAYIAPDSRVHEFVTPHDPGRFVIGFSGAGMPPFDYVTQRSPFQHGETVKDFFARPRVMQLLTRENFCDRDGWWNGRTTLLDDLRPNRQLTSTGSTPGVLRFVRTDGSVRDIEVFIEEGPRFEPASAGTWDEWSFQEVLRFIAHNPIFFDPTQATLTFAIVLDSDLVFPITFPITFGSGEVDLTSNITYLGSWEEFPIIAITGPLEDVRIDNLTTGEFIALDADVSAGRTVTIDLRPGFKTVTDDLGNNLIGIVSADSDLGTFHIAPDPEATNGINAMRLQGQHPTGATSVVISFFTRFVGI